MMNRVPHSSKPKLQLRQAASLCCYRRPFPNLKDTLSTAERWSFITQAHAHTGSRCRSSRCQMQRLWWNLSLNVHKNMIRCEIAPWTGNSICIVHCNEIYGDANLQTLFFCCSLGFEKQPLSVRYYRLTLRELFLKKKKNQ